MKTFEIVSQERPWYGSPYYREKYSARNADSAIKKAMREHPDCVWFWFAGEVVHTNERALKKYQNANPGVTFDHH